MKRHDLLKSACKFCFCAQFYQMPINSYDIKKRQYGTAERSFGSLFLLWSLGSEHLISSDHWFSPHLKTHHCSCVYSGKYWCIVQYKFKIYSINIWLIYIMKWLSQIISSKYKIKEKSFSLWWQLLGFTVLTTFMYNI